MIGSWGTVIQFTVNSSQNNTKVLTPASVEVTGSARWGEHAIVGQRPQLEFIGPGGRTCTMPIRLDARHGVSVQSQIDALYYAMDTGRAEVLTMGTRAVFPGNSQAVIESIAENREVFDRVGNTQVATLTVTWRMQSAPAVATATKKAGIAKANVKRKRA